MPGLDSLRWCQFADSLPRTARKVQENLEEIKSELRARNEIELERNALLREQNALLTKLISEVAQK